jgi:hypothetical protein
VKDLFVYITFSNLCALTGRGRLEEDQEQQLGATTSNMMMGHILEPPLNVVTDIVYHIMKTNWIEVFEISHLDIP